MNQHPSGLVWRLIAKDFELHRAPMLVTIGAGVLGLAILQFKGMAGLLGTIGFFSTLIVLGSILPQSTVVGERKAQTLTFLMSLPIAAAQYTTAKILAALGMFVIPWMILGIGAVSLILGRSDIPDGIIPIALALVTLPLVGFCIMTAVAIVGESEGWVIAFMVAINVGYSLVWPLIASNDELRAGLGSPVPIWSPAVLRLLGAEFSVIAAVLAIMFYLQSKKHDFV